MTVLGATEKITSKWMVVKTVRNKKRVATDQVKHAHHLTFLLLASGQIESSGYI